MRGNWSKVTQELDWKPSTACPTSTVIGRAVTGAALAVREDCLGAVTERRGLKPLSSSPAREPGPPLPGPREAPACLSGDSMETSCSEVTAPWGDKEGLPSTIRGHKLLLGLSGTSPSRGQVGRLHCGPSLALAGLCSCIGRSGARTHGADGLPQATPRKGLRPPKPSAHGEGRWSCDAARTEQSDLRPSASLARRHQRPRLLCVSRSIQATEPPALRASAEMATTTGHQRGA